MQHSCIVVYTTVLAPVIAFRLSWILWPWYRLCLSLRFCFLTNISDGVGHITLEIENFFLRLASGELSPQRRYIVLRPSHPISKGFLSLYKQPFFFTSTHSWLYYLTFPLLIRYPKITLDAGFSRSKWNLLSPQNDASLAPNTWPRITTKSFNLREWEEYLVRKAQRPHLHPLRDLLPPQPVYPKCASKTALIHLKTQCINATAAPTDPDTYLPTLQYLIAHDYQLIFVGREIMPKSFQPYITMNYSESSLASFRNDYHIFRNADLAITGGSGIFFLANCLDVPLLYLNYWHLFRLPVGRKSMGVPTLVQNMSNEWLSFTQQWAYYTEAHDAAAEIFPTEILRPRNASADEILEGCKELLAWGQQEESLPSPLQLKFRTLSCASQASPCRISDYFLRKHIARMG